MTALRDHAIDITTLKREHLLTDLLVARGIPLRRTGAETFVARCPFHDDHRPSLLVDGRDQHFHCFGCGAHGDVLDFLMRADGLGFAAARERLVGITPRSPLARSPATLPPRREDSSGPPSGERRWDRLGLDEQVVMNLAAALYQHRLWHEPRALAYVRARGIPDWVIRECALGYADGHSLESDVTRHSGLRIAEDLGLLRRSRRGKTGGAPREFLAGRIVVPEVRGGNCIWFIGRRLDDIPNRPKYLALGGERPVLGVERAAGQRQAVLCEGVFDFLTAVAWKLPAWSPCGTNLPTDRIGFLARATTVYGALDADDAGRRAATSWSTTFGSRWRSLSLPDGCDLNDLARRPDGRATFFHLLAQARPAMTNSGGYHAHRD